MLIKGVIKSFHSNLSGRRAYKVQLEWLQDATDSFDRSAVILIHGDHQHGMHNSYSLTSKDYRPQLKTFAVTDVC